MTSITVWKNDDTIQVVHDVRSIRLDDETNKYYTLDLLLKLIKESDLP